MLVIRFFRTGKKNQPLYKIVVTDKSKSSVKGTYVEEVGFFDPIKDKKILKAERIKYWISVGAKPSATVHNLLISEKIIEGKKISKFKKPKEKEEKKEEASSAATAAAPAEPKAEEVKVEKAPEPVKEPEVPKTEEVSKAPEEESKTPETPKTTEAPKVPEAKPAEPAEVKPVEPEAISKPEEKPEIK